jgi:hypothetical protein
LPKFLEELLKSLENMRKIRDESTDIDRHSLTKVVICALWDAKNLKINKEQCALGMMVTGRRRRRRG